METVPPGMSQNHSSRSKVVAVCAVIFALGLAAAAVEYHLEDAQRVAQLEREAQTAAAAFDEPAPAADAGAANLAAVRRRLQRIAAADARVRTAYLLRARAAPARAQVVADSTTETASDARLAALAAADTQPAPGLLSVISGDASGYTGPRRDSAGTWVTGYARLSPAVANTAAPVAIVGLEVRADDWVRALALAAVRGALSAWAVLGFAVFAFMNSRRQGEQREAIRNLSEAVDQSHSAILILDLEHRIEYANRGLCQQIGYSRRELIGHHWRDLLTAPDCAGIIADLIVTVQSGCAWEGEWRNRRKDGTEYPVHGMVTPVKHRDGSLACFVATFDDVTDVKRKEAELREARDLAEAADRAKGQFLATMSHEVRTPLNGIVGFTSLLLETPLSAEQREFVQTIRASGEALIQLTADILDYARIESGKLKLDPMACDPRECIEEALDLHAAKAAEKNIELLHHADDNVPAAVVVDGGRLRQVLVNLVGNAVKFTERGEVEVSVRALERSVDGMVGPLRINGVAPGEAKKCILEFTIRDTGIGIAEDERSRLFKPFSQIDESSTRRYGGAGLGLAICKNIVHLLGGDITLESTPGKGTTFTFTVEVPVAAALPPQRRLDGLTLGLAVRPGSLRRKLADLLTSWGADVRQADTPAQLAGGDQEFSLVEVTDAMARELVRTPAPAPVLPPHQALALVPMSLPSELRSGLRTHFRLLINRPVHHGPLYALLSGTRSTTDVGNAQATRFGLRVLVVEDNAVNQRLLERVLDTVGCTWTVVSNGREAMEELAARAQNYDLVLLDLHMPELDGLSALERIRRGEAGPRAQTMWFIAVTADVRPEQRRRGFAVGLNDYLTKPLRVPELEAAFRRFRTERLARKS